MHILSHEWKWFIVIYCENMDAAFVLVLVYLKSSVK